MTPQFRCSQTVRLGSIKQFNLNSQFLWHVQDNVVIARLFGAFTIGLSAAIQLFEFQWGFRAAVKSHLTGYKKDLYQRNWTPTVIWVGNHISIIGMQYIYSFVFDISNVAIDNTWIPWNLSFRYILLHEKRLQAMLWHHKARVNSHQRWK